MFNESNNISNMKSVSINNQISQIIHLFVFSSQLFFVYLLETRTKTKSLKLKTANSSSIKQRAKVCKVHLRLEKEQLKVV